MEATTHENIRSFLIRHLRKTTPRNDFIGPSVEEVLECDKAIFVELQKRCDRDDAGLAGLALHVDPVLQDTETVAMVGWHMGSGRASARRKGADIPGAPPAAKAKTTPGPNAAKHKAKKDRQNAQRAAEKAELERLRQGAGGHTPGAHPGPPQTPHPNAKCGGKAQREGKGKGRGKGKA